ncbi:MAG: coenzyme F420-0:L-glutamate ligase [Candidatus Bathyarchaeota archaeon]|nr:MAG: coenzyme F420-0:L-glutamate ligase [Candidatus Bathyarchaeota archaeon]
MKHYKAFAIVTKYWKTKQDLFANMITALKGRVRESDFLVVSEKAICTATGNILDEGKIKPSRTAQFLVKYWMRYVWAYILGPLCHSQKETLLRFKKYPLKKGSAHKQAALQHCGLLQALMPYSEGGIDSSNLPYSFVSLPLKNADRIAEKIRNTIYSELGLNVTVIIADTDKTYSWKSFHFTPRSRPIIGIQSITGFVAYIVGRFFKLKRRATPIAVKGENLSAEEALDIADIANNIQGVGAGKTVWDMARAFNVSLNGVSWKMLEETKHKSMAVVRRHID